MCAAPPKLLSGGGEGRNKSGAGKLIYRRLNCIVPPKCSQKTWGDTNQPKMGYLEIEITVSSIKTKNICVYVYRFHSPLILVDLCAVNGLTKTTYAI